MGLAHYPPSSNADDSTPNEPLPPDPYAEDYDPATAGDWAQALPAGADDAPPPSDEDAPICEDAYTAGYAPVDNVGGPPTGASRDSGNDEYVTDEIHEVLARLEFHPNADARALVQTMAINKKVLGRLSPERRRTVKSVFEVLLFEWDNTPGGVVHYDALSRSPLLTEYRPEIRVEIERVARMVSGGLPDGTAPTRWEELREHVQRQETLRSARALVSRLRAKESREELLDAFRKLEPPTVHRAEAAARTIKTAAEVDAEERALQETRPAMRFSSGYPTLDLALTGPDEPIGFVAPGEQTIFAGITGTGKSSFSYGIVPALAQDIRNWGLDEGMLVFAHTEESSAVKIRASGLARGGRYHDLASHVVVENIGSSRQRLVEVVYELVMRAQDRADQTGRDICDFLPYVLVLDYIQAITGSTNEQATQATFNTAELVMRGFQEWNPDEIAKFGGLTFRDYAGRAWPEGTDHHKLAIVTFAQLNKQDDRLMFYRPNSRDHPLGEFSLEDSSADPVWRDPISGNGYAWEVRPGDARVMRQNAINGSQRILQNATNIISLHRSRSHNNPASFDEAAQRFHLADTRARLVPDKTRNGSQMVVIPMTFDVDREGFRARYYDTAATEEFLSGRFKVADGWREEGDPLLPLRPLPRPLSGIRY